MTRRIWISYGIDQLEAEFERGEQDRTVLKRLANELSFRKTRRAARLSKKVEGALRRSDGGASDQSSKTLIPSSTEPVLRATPTLPFEGHQATSHQVLPDPAPYDPDLVPLPLSWDSMDSEDDSLEAGDETDSLSTFTDRPIDILQAWIAIEALSPVAYRKPRDLVAGDGGQRPLTNPLPWTEGRKAKPRTQLYYVCFLGAVRMEPVTEALLRQFVDKREERPSAEGFAALGAILVDRYGVPLSEDSISVSSFGWAAGRVLKGQLSYLSKWEKAETRLIAGLESILVREDDDGNGLPLTIERLEAAFRWLVASCGIPSEFTEPPSTVTWIYHRFGKGLPSAPILNSFYLRDLLQARGKAQAGKCNAALSKYLGAHGSSSRCDLLENREALADALAPDQTPLARWPSQGRYPLVLLQQAAVNLAVGRTDSSPLISVNGPPGTGKTTLLRDVVAALVAERAEQLLEFEDPCDAFVHAGQMKLGNGFVHLYEIDPRLRGFEILVASSNNKAVENISRELPRADAIDPGLPPPNYFRTMATALNDGAPCWGAAAAVLGNASNVYKYASTLWWDDDVGLRNYLAWISGKRTQIVRESEEGGAGIYEDPRSVSEWAAPEDHEEALQRWRTAKARFRRVLERSAREQASLQRGFEAARELTSLEAAFRASEAELKTAQARLEVVSQDTTEADQLVASTETVKDHADKLVVESRLVRPGFLQRLLRSPRATEWRQTHDQARLAAAEARIALKGAKSARAAAETAKGEAATRALSTQGRVDQCRRDRDTSAEAVGDARKATDGRLIDSAFWEAPYAERQATPPNFPDSAHLLRDEVFSAAFILHKAFIDAAAKPMRHNLSAFNALITGRIQKPEHRKLAPDLWTSAFLVTPVISTTFASVTKLLKALPEDSLGWLLIDEAGQATPQSAVGAIMRSRRTIVVGDPLQLEPIVSLPLPLVRGIAASCNVDPDRWMSPLTSAQGVADEASDFGAVIQRDVGEAWVGAPLLVHRRCEDPMFSISNNLAYGGLMVQATAAKHSPIAETLGESRWIDVRSDAPGKWSDEEGRVVLEMLEAASRETPGAPSLFVITPFRVVAQTMRGLAERSTELRQYLETPSEWIADHIGTIHTFQGKEAQAVVLLLGAPGEGERGARAWATGQTNLLNVAVSRAKHALYVIGRRSAWGEMGCMLQISRILGAGAESRQGRMPR